MIDDDIAELWRQEPPLPLSAIAHELGLTRGSIAGRVARARRNGDERFPTRPRPTAERISKPAAVRPRQKPEPIVAVCFPNGGKSPRPVVAVASPTRFRSATKPQGDPALRAVEPLPLTSLQADQCRWPINAPERGGAFLFCAAPASGNYCARHAAMAHSSVSATSSWLSPRAPASTRGSG